MKGGTTSKIGNSRRSSVGICSSKDGEIIKGTIESKIGSNRRSSAGSSFSKSSIGSMNNGTAPHTANENRRFSVGGAVPSNGSATTKHITTPTKMTKQRRTAIPRPSSRFARPTGKIFPPKIFCDPDSAEKQCRAYTEWLNHHFRHDTDATADSAPETSNDIQCRVFRILLWNRRTGATRRAASALYGSPDLLEVRRVVGSEVRRGRLSMRHDRDVYSDLGARRNMMELLLSYRTKWLTVGMEAIQKSGPERCAQRHESGTGPARFLQRHDTRHVGRHPARRGYGSPAGPAGGGEPGAPLASLHGAQGPPLLQLLLQRNHATPQNRPPRERPATSRVSPQILDSNRKYSLSPTS